MSVVHQLSPGWLLDHLSFINKINYQVHGHHEPCCSKNEPTTSVHLDSLHVDSMTSFGSSAKFIASGSTTKPENEDRGNCEVFMQKYIFRSELFDINKPHIISAVHKECQSNEKEDVMNGIKKEISISTLRKVESFKKFLYFYRKHKTFIIPMSQISCDLLNIKNKA